MQGRFGCSCFDLENSSQFIPLKLVDMSVGSEPPVPLPPPAVSHANKNEVCSIAAPVTCWGTIAENQLLEVEPSLPGRENNQPKCSHPSRGSNRNCRPSGGDRTIVKSGLVERPPAAMTMIGMISQPNRVVRVLARGEKLDAVP